ncbi:hypothetical protein G7054_g3115 [Neopestalotiopsis clavispora]|nr:hypothetical protein G7054_g3115 [Neopestalotiopsis clavispora]
MAQHYVYKPLAEGQIRLLNICLDESEPHGIALSLCHVSLDDSKGEYVALSYTWGRPEPLDLDPTFQPDNTWRLNCNGGVVEVRQNLFDFLQQVRRAGSNASAFWIDAVCINQQDDKEKSEQVFRMGQIYAASSQVWIWLGGRPISIEVQQIIEEFIPAMRKDDNDRNYDNDFYQNIDILDEKSSNALIQAIGYEKWAMWKSSWRQYRALFARNWFKRGWTVQEAALRAPEHCSVLVGSYVIDWDLILKFSSLLLISRWPLVREVPTLFEITMIRVLTCYHSNSASSQPVLTAREAVALKHKWHTDFLNLILRARNLYVEDPRDRIYAYLGMMLQNKPPSVENSIVPDYALDVEFVFQNFATVILQNVSDLGIIAIIQDSQDRVYSKLPSWVPDFSQSLEDRHPLEYDAGQIRHNIMNEPEIRGNYLILHGAQLESISYYGQSDEQSVDFLHQLVTSFIAGKDVGSGQFGPEAVWTALLAGYTSASGIKDHALKRRVRHWFHQKIWDLRHRDAPHASLSVLLARVADDENVKEWLPTLEEVMTPDEPSRDEEFEKYVKFAFFKRRIYYTASGSFGIGPASLRSGDQVYIFKGGRVPFVLRQNDDGETYTLLGTTYVHGVMYGEAMTDEFRSSFRPVTLV